jgi:hypothetical protein
MTGVRTVIPSVQLNRQEFNKRFSTRFFDPLFDRLGRRADSGRRFCRSDF